MTPALRDFIQARLAERELAAGVYVPHPEHPELHGHIASTPDGMEWFVRTHASGMLPHSHDPETNFQIPVPDEAAPWLAASPVAWSALFREGNIIRAILAEHVPAEDELDMAIRTFAALWNGHPDYREEWKP